MATNYATQTFTIPDHQLYASQQPSPASSASPASPRMHEYLQQVAPNPYKQLRPMKSPLYVPAALRPTEHFSTTSPMTPPKSLHGSLDNLEDEPVSQSPEEHHLDGFDHDWLQAEELNDVTGPPKKDHWKVGQQATVCSRQEFDCIWITDINVHACVANICSTLA